MRQPIDAIILAGDRAASRDVLGKNKMSLEAGGLPLLLYVLKALEGVERVERVLIIGPQKKIEDLLRRHSGALKGKKPIQALEQRENMYRNFWSAFIHSIPGYQEGMEKENAGIMEKMVLALPCDLPFITSSEIDEFLDACDVENLDYCLGMTEEKYLSKFYPEGPKPGVRMAYLSMKEGNFRVNNLHLVRPFRILNRDYIETIFERRYQKNMINIIKVFVDFFLRKGFGLRAVYLYSLLELSVFFRHVGLAAWSKALRDRVSLDEIRSFASKLLRTRIDIVETTGGGAALDVDNAADFKTIQERYQEWARLFPK